MDPAVRRLIEAIHAHSCKCVLALTGGGTQAAALLLNVPGGSRTILETIVPYHEQALIDFLGRRPPSFCSQQTSLDIAIRAHQRARWLAPGKDVIGLGCAASLVSDRPKRGDHRFHIATYSELHSSRFSLTLTKGARDREAEEAVVDAILLNALAAAFGVAEQLSLPLLPGEELRSEVVNPDHPLARLLTGKLARLCVARDGRYFVDAVPPAALLAGSFNPAHVGHWQLAAVAAGRIHGEVAFELSVTNVDKPMLGAEAIRCRLAAFSWRSEIWLTRAPTFAEKAALFPGVVFVVGADTALRLVQIKYYGGDETAMDTALESIRARGCRFLVAGRTDADGRFVELDQLAIPERFRNLFTPIPQAEFHVELSSTRLRECESRVGVAAEEAGE